MSETVIRARYDIGLEMVRIPSGENRGFEVRWPGIGEKNIRHFGSNGTEATRYYHEIRDMLMATQLAR